MALDREIHKELLETKFVYFQRFSAYIFVKYVQLYVSTEQVV